MAALRASFEPCVLLPDKGAGNGRGVSPKLALVETVPAPPIFSPLELLVIGIGKCGRSTLVKRGSRLTRVQRLLFWIEASTPFGGARLEALRSLVVALRRRELPDAGPTAALAAGVTPRQIEHLRSSR